MLLTTGDRDGERERERAREGGIERSHASERERKTEGDKKQAVHEGRLWMHHLCRISSVCALILRILISASHTKSKAIFGYANYWHLGRSPRPAPSQATLASESSSSTLPLIFSFEKTIEDDNRKVQMPKVQIPRMLPDCQGYEVESWPKTARSPTHWPDDFSPQGSPVDHSRAPRPLAEIVQWLLQQQIPQLLAATESLRDRWRNDAATLECLRELTKLDLSACEISRFEHRGSDQYKERWKDRPRSEPQQRIQGDREGVYSCET